MIAHLSSRQKNTEKISMVCTVSICRYPYPKNYTLPGLTKVSKLSQSILILLPIIAFIQEHTDSLCVTRADKNDSL